MKRLFVTAVLALVLWSTGCAYLHSTTERSTDPKTGIVTEKTYAKAYTIFDANANLTKFANRSGYTDGSTNKWAPGTYISNLNESSTTTNLVNIIGAVAQGIVQGMK